MSDCIFCKIIKGELPCSKIYDDECVIAIMDIQPVNQGHVLIIPKQHFELITELDEELAAHIMIVANTVNAAIRKSSLKSEAINYFLADGKAAGQDVFHVHLHVIPRCKRDGFGLKFSKKYFQLPYRIVLDEAAEIIRLNM